jgi:hypothetical protein
MLEPIFGGKLRCGGARDGSVSTRSPLKHFALFGSGRYSEGPPRRHGCVPVESVAVQRGHRHPREAFGAHHGGKRRVGAVGGAGAGAVRVSGAGAGCVCVSVSRAHVEHLQRRVGGGGAALLRTRGVFPVDAESATSPYQSSSGLVDVGFRHGEMEGELKRETAVSVFRGVVGSLGVSFSPDLYVHVPRKSPRALGACSNHAVLHQSTVGWRGGCSDEKVANRDIRVWHGATEHGP